MSKNWKQGGSGAAQWQRIRRAVLERDGYKCQLRLGCCTGKATQVHHTYPREVKGDDPAYLLSACAECNNAAGDPSKYNPQVTRRRWWE